MSDLECNYDSDQDVAENHSELVEAVRQLDKSQRVRKPERSEPSLHVSEFHLVKSGIADEDAIEIEDLAKTLGKKGNLGDLGKKINAASIKSKVLPKPLEKPAAERIKRTVGFENTKTELQKWSGIIARNRTAASVSFPLSQASMKLEPTKDYLTRFRLQSELEKQLAEIEPREEPEEEKDEFPLTLQELIEKRKEAAKIRAQQSYKVAKAQRQNKIKSKKFHRIQRKERIRKTLKEFETLQKTDPSAALEKLNELDKARAEERMSLRHKSTGQWAKNKQVRAKYDKESRQVLAEQLSIGRELTQKVNKDDESDEEDDEDQPMNLPIEDKENPWLNTIKKQSEVEEFVGRYRKYYDQQKALNDDKNKVTDNNSNQDQNEKNNDILKESNNKIPKSKNPVEKVVEEYFPKNDFKDSDESISNESDSNELNKSDIENNINIVDKSKKNKLEKTLIDKSDTNLKKNLVKKIKESKVKVGTTTWLISPIKSKVEKTTKNKKEFDIDEMFDSIEDKIQDKITKKLRGVKRMLENEEKMENKKKVKRKKDDSVSDVDKLGLKGQKQIKPILDKPLEESSSFQPSNQNSEFETIGNITDFNSYVTSEEKKAEIDPNKFMNIKPSFLKTAIPNETGGEENVMDDSEPEDQQQLISEAFADDDVVEDFRKEKEEEIKKDQIEDVNLQLPGWGSWGGKNIKPSSRKKRRFIIKMPKPAPRRDENKGDVVIIEEAQSKIKKHLVNELPFPFTRVRDFEASIRAPLGRNFIPEKTFSKLIQPAVKTKMGKIIEPMSEDMLVKMKSTTKLKKELRRQEKKLNLEKKLTERKKEDQRKSKLGKKGDQRKPKFGKKEDQGKPKLGKKEDQGKPKLGKKENQEKPKLGKKEDQGKPKLGKKEDQRKPNLRKKVIKGTVSKKKKPSLEKKLTQRKSLKVQKNKTVNCN